MWIAIYVAIAATVIGSLVGIYAAHRAIRYYITILANKEGK